MEKERVKSFIKIAFVIILLIAAFLTALKILFAGYDMDEQYAFALSYRLIQGDILIKNMWEPHQLSALFLALIMFPFLKVFSTTGIVLYSRAISLIIHGCLMFFLWRYLKKKTTKFSALCVTIIIAFSLPKIMFLAEFSNVHMWCLMITILSLLEYVELDSRWKQRLLIILAGIGFVGSVLSYPSLVLMLFFYVVFFLRFGKKGIKKIEALLIFVLPGFMFLGIMLFYVSTKVGLENVRFGVEAILSDGSQSDSLLTKLMAHKDSLIEVLKFAGIYGVISTIVWFVIRKKAEIKGLPLFCILLAFVTTAGQMFIWIAFRKYPNYPLVEYCFVPLVEMILLFAGKKGISKEFLLWNIVPVSSFVGICMLSNHPFLVSLPFLAYAIVGVVAVDEIRTLFQEKRIAAILLFVWAIVVCFGHSYLLRVNGGRHITCFDDLSLIRSGPAVGIIAEPEMVYSNRQIHQIVLDTIPVGSKVFYMGRYNDIYLTGNYVVCSPNTISTPTFNELTIEYFRKNPDKYPAYIVCDLEYLEYAESLFMKEGFKKIAQNEETVIFGYE